MQIISPQGESGTATGFSTPEQIDQLATFTGAPNATDLFIIIDTDDMSGSSFGTPKKIAASKVVTLDDYNYATVGGAIHVVGNTFDGSVPGVSNVRIGNLSGSPRVILDNGSSSVQLDNSSGVFRIFKPGFVFLTIDNSGNTTLGVSGGASVFNGQIGTNWAGLSFGAGWADYGAGYQPCQYKKVGDLVFLRGLANWVSGASQVIGNLPVGFRPTATCLFDAIDANNQGRIDIQTNGNLFLQTGVLDWVSLDGIVFSVL